MARVDAICDGSNNACPVQLFNVVSVRNVYNMVSSYYFKYGNEDRVAEKMEVNHWIVSQFFTCIAKKKELLSIMVADCSAERVSITM